MSQQTTKGSKFARLALMLAGALFVAWLILSDTYGPRIVFSDPVPTATLDLTTSTPDVNVEPTWHLPVLGAYGTRVTPAPYGATPTPDPFETDEVGWP